MLHTQMRRRKRLLRRLGHCDADGVIQLKGRVACEINTCDELVVTELIFSGAFNELSPQQSAAVLSCMVHQVCSLLEFSKWIIKAPRYSDERSVTAFFCIRKIR